MVFYKARSDSLASSSLLTSLSLTQMPLWKSISLLFLSTCMVSYGLPLTDPTPTTPSQPTTPPAFNLVKRDDNLQATLSLYQNWASVCNGNAVQAVASIGVDPKIQQLWQTVTQTVNCGHGTVKTVTKTITATATATYSPSPKAPPCDGKCWSDYLWRKSLFLCLHIHNSPLLLFMVDTYGYGISVAQAFTGIVCMLIGIYFMAFGFHFFRPTMALTGFVFFGKKKTFFFFLSISVLSPPF
jgi:hypothetical protein